MEDSHKAKKTVKKLSRRHAAFTCLCRNTGESFLTQRHFLCAATLAIKIPLLRKLVKHFFVMRV